MHFLTPSFLALHVATCLALGFIHKAARELFHKLVDRVTDALFAPMLNLISKMESVLKLVVAGSILLAFWRFGVCLAKKS